MSRTVEGPRCQRTRKISSSAAVGECGEDFFIAAFSYEEHSTKFFVVSTEFHSRDAGIDGFYENKVELANRLMKFCSAIHIPNYFRAVGLVTIEAFATASNFSSRSLGSRASWSEPDLIEMPTRNALPIAGGACCLS